MRRFRSLAYTCFFGMLSFVITALLSAYYNPWFDFFKNAFSDLGGNRANMPWIYNYGLIVTSVFIMLFSIYLILVANNKLETISGGFFFIAGIFLALVGIYHAGTRPHVFVSTYFFVQSDFSILAWSLGILGKSRLIGITFLVISLISPLLAAVIPWPSVATQEAFGIVIISAWAATAFFHYRKI